LEDYTWVLHILVFVFGYVTCKTFYFMKSVRLGLTTLHICHVVGLYTILKGLENYHYTKTMKIKSLKESDESTQVIDAYERNFNEEINMYKNKSIEQIINMHPNFFKDVIKFHDWDSAMRYLSHDGAEFLKKFNKQ